MDHDGRGSGIGRGTRVVACVISASNKKQAHDSGALQLSSGHHIEQRCKRTPWGQFHKLICALCQKVCALHPTDWHKGAKQFMKSTPCGGFIFQW